MKDVLFRGKSHLDYGLHLDLGLCGLGRSVRIRGPLCTSWKWFPSKEFRLDNWSITVAVLISLVRKFGLLLSPLSQSMTKEYWPFPHSSPQLSVAPQLVVGVHEPLPLHAGMLTGLILCMSCAGSHSWCKFMRVAVLSYPLFHLDPPQPLALKIFPPFVDAPWAMSRSDMNL